MSDKNMYKPNDICLTLSARVDREMSTTLSKWAAMYLYYITVQSYSSAEVPVSQHDNDVSYFSWQRTC